jgi:Fe-S cluster biosynthesis and repair protein YggX
MARSTLNQPIFIILSFIDDKHTACLLINNNKLSKTNNINKLYMDNEVVALFFKGKMKLRGALSDSALH